MGNEEGSTSRSRLTELAVRYFKKEGYKVNQENTALEASQVPRANSTSSSRRGAWNRRLDTRLEQNNRCQRYHHSGHVIR